MTFLSSTALAPAVLFTLLAATGARSIAQDTPAPPLWLRNAAISPDGRSIAFCYQGDIWRVPAAGGDAVPLTTNEALDHSPVWSRDGRRIAFSSLRHGNGDVFVMPADGGPPTRLTFHSTGETPTDFSADGSQVIFYGGRQDDARDQ